MTGPTEPVVPALHLPRALAHLQPRPLTVAQADEALAFRRSVLHGMPDALRADDPVTAGSPAVEQQWADAHLGGRARALGVWSGASLVALACLQLADETDPADPGHLLGLQGPQWTRAAHMAACLVHEDYRGLHLQAKLLNWRRDVALAGGRSLITAMTACGNLYSRRNLLAAGLGIQWIGQRRPGSWWYGLVLDAAPKSDPLADRDHEWVDGNDFERQSALIDQGFVGVAEAAWLSGDREPVPRLQYVRRNPRPMRPEAPAGDRHGNTRECV